ncbi:hypothetical protein Ahy_A04g017811 [Arachis hypogaea]|uniref:6-phosphogluconate dehydrogenase NADP-binding domain-containing protein n=1 Tax=Arachis hypogaea TaxID=3818 RepID=A0A445DC58_ARAHY|nr:hypothetical protein Ahy_A04g017811 [Arachis hypogaea]
MANVVQEPGIVSDPTQIDVKLFNRWSFDDVQEIKVLRIRQERELVEGENRRYRQVPEEQEDKARGSSTSSQQQFQIDVACGNHGATNGMALGKGYVNVSTVDVDTSKLISERIKSTGALFLEAPVSGSKKPAEDGQLIFLTAGEGIQAPFHGRSKFYLGDVGNGAAMKLVNMIMGRLTSQRESWVGSKSTSRGSFTGCNQCSNVLNQRPIYDTIALPYCIPSKASGEGFETCTGVSRVCIPIYPIAAAANELYKVAKSYGLMRISQLSLKY